MPTSSENEIQLLPRKAKNKKSKKFKSFFKDLFESKVFAEEQSLYSFVVKNKIIRNNQRQQENNYKN